MSVRLTRCPGCICIIHGQLALPTAVPGVDLDPEGPDSDMGRNPTSTVDPEGPDSDMGRNPTSTVDPEGPDSATGRNPTSTVDPEGPDNDTDRNPTSTVDPEGPDSDTGRNPTSVRTGCPPYTAQECSLPTFTETIIISAIVINTKRTSLCSASSVGCQRDAARICC